MGQNLFPSKAFLVTQYLVNILPAILAIVIVFSGIDLVNALAADPYGEAVVKAARKTGRVCRYTVVAIMLSQIGVNVLQFAFGSQIRYSDYTLNIPLLSVIFVLAAMVLAGYFEKARQLKADNDLFV